MKNIKRKVFVSLLISVILIVVSPVAVLYSRKQKILHEDHE
jgi:hypothetical protein